MPVKKPYEGKTWTYKQLADELGTNTNLLYAFIGRGNNRNLLPPIDPTTNAYEFTDADAQRFMEVWRESSEFRAAQNPPDGEAFTEEGALDYIGADNPSRIQYMRRRYNMLYPDYYAPNPSGRGRTIAMYLKDSLDEFLQWEADGKPEPPHSQVKTIIEFHGEYRYLVEFRNGTTLGFLSDDEVRTSPVMPQYVAERYIRSAKSAIRKHEKSRVRAEKIARTRAQQALEEKHQCFSAPV